MAIGSGRDRVRQGQFRVLFVHDLRNIADDFFTKPLPVAGLSLAIVLWLPSSPSTLPTTTLL
jgi:hypothetical protein